MDPRLHEDDLQGGLCDNVSFVYFFVYCIREKFIA